MNNNVDLSFWDRREKIKTIALSLILMVAGGLISVSIINAKPDDALSALILFISASLAGISFLVFLTSFFRPSKNKQRKLKGKKVKSKNKIKKQEVSIMTQKWVKVAIAFAVMAVSGMIEAAFFQLGWNDNIIGLALTYIIGLVVLGAFWAFIVLIFE